MKLEVGMYVRTKITKVCNCVYIRKIDKIEKDIEKAEGSPIYLDGEVIDYWGDEQIWIGIEDILKASHNIIDLIEPMDLMYIDISPDDCGGIIVPRIAETLNELKIWKERFDSGSCILKGVITKEQIKENIYWLGD